jgi:hypothetical protein
VGVVKLTTKEAAALATERGYPVQARTVKQWCLRGRIAGAVRVGSERRGEWQIPREAFEAFLETRSNPPKGGRPRRPPEGAAGEGEG